MLTRQQRIRYLEEPKAGESDLPAACVPAGSAGAASGWGTVSCATRSRAALTRGTKTWLYSLMTSPVSGRGGVPACTYPHGVRTEAAQTDEQTTTWIEENSRTLEERPSQRAA